MKLAAFIKMCAVTATVVFLVSSCANQPPTSVRVDFPTQLAFSQVFQAPGSYEGKSVRWGGVINNIINLKMETELEVVSKPLDKSAQPIVDAKSPGRFLVRIQGFLEPTEFAAGREITVVGIVSGTETRKIGEFEYTYPKVQAEGYHLWEERVEPIHYNDPWYLDPWYWRYPRYPWWYY